MASKSLTQEIPIAIINKKYLFVTFASLEHPIWFETLPFTLSVFCLIVFIVQQKGICHCLFISSSSLFQVQTVFINLVYGNILKCNVRTSSCNSCLVQRQTTHILLKVDFQTNCTTILICCKGKNTIIISVCHIFLSNVYFI